MVHFGGTFAGIIAAFVTMLVIGGILALGRNRDPINIARGTTWYSYFAISLSATTALSGLALIIKSVIGYINIDWSYINLSDISNSFSNTSSGINDSGNGFLKILATRLHP